MSVVVEALKSQAPYHSLWVFAHRVNRNNRPLASLNEHSSIYFVTPGNLYRVASTSPESLRWWWTVLRQRIQWFEHGPTLEAYLNLTLALPSR